MQENKSRQNLSQVEEEKRLEQSTEIEEKQNIMSMITKKGQEKEITVS